MPKRDPDDDDRSDEEEVRKTDKKRKSDSKAEGSKTAKKVEKAAGAEIGTIQQDKDGKPCLNLSEYRRVTINEFKGAKLVDIRELYKDKDSGEMKFGKKGISLNMDQWKVLRSSIDLIDKMIGDE